MAFVPISISIRDQIVPVSGSGSLFEIIGRIGVNRIEVTVDGDGLLPHLRAREGKPLSIRDDESVLELREVLQIEGTQISAFLLATDFSGPDADLHLAWAAQVVHTASRLQIPVVRIDPLTSEHLLTMQAIRDRFGRRVNQLLYDTKETSVDLGMENHGRLFNDPTILDQVLTEIPDPRFGLTLDTGNLYWWGHPISRVYELIERYAPRVKHTHIKNIRYPSALRDKQRAIGFEYEKYCGTLYNGDLDLRRIVKILRQAGYRRDLCVEDESLFKVPEGERVEILRRNVACLRDAQ